MSSVYGILDKTLYRMATLQKGQVLPYDSFRSHSYSRENTGEQTFTTMVKFNSGDLFKRQTNDEIYLGILQYIQEKGLTDIETLYTEFKVAVDYTLTDQHGCVITEGVVISPAKARDVYINYPLNERNRLDTKRVKDISSKTTISRIVPAQYGIMDSNTIRYYKFKINGIYVYGNLTDKEKSQYIRHLNPSIIDTTFSYSSGTYRNLRQTHIMVFDSTMFDCKFDEHIIAFRPQAIKVEFELLLDNFCEVFDDTEIWRLIERNGGKKSTDPYIYPGIVDPFRPVTDPGACPHNGDNHGDNHGPAPYNDGMLHPHYPHHPIFPPKPPVDPIVKPTPEDQKPSVIPDANDVPNDGDAFRPDEWCRVDGIANPNEEAYFLVVPDDLPDEEFDAITMVRYSSVKPYVSDIQVGDYVYHHDVLYI